LKYFKDLLACWASFASAAPAAPEIWWVPKGGRT